MTRFLELAESQEWIPLHEMSIVPAVRWEQGELPEFWKFHHHADPLHGDGKDWVLGSVAPIFVERPENIHTPPGFSFLSRFASRLGPLQLAMQQADFFAALDAQDAEALLRWKRCEYWLDHPVDLDAMEGWVFPIPVNELEPLSLYLVYEDEQGNMFISEIPATEEWGEALASIGMDARFHPRQWMEILALECRRDPVDFWISCIPPEILSWSESWVSILEKTEWTHPPEDHGNAHPVLDAPETVAPCQENVSIELALDEKDAGVSTTTKIVETPTKIHAEVSPDAMVPSTEASVAVARSSLVVRPASTERFWIGSSKSKRFLPFAEIVRQFCIFPQMQKEFVWINKEWKDLPSWLRSMGIISMHAAKTTVFPSFGMTIPFMGPRSAKEEDLRQRLKWKRSIF